MTRMHVEVNGVRLAFSVEPAPAPVPGAAPRPRVVRLYGGPGGPHADADPLAAAELDDAAECVRLALRGSGGSESGAPGRLHLEQWAWDLRVFCAAVGIERPVVLAAGANAAVALLYAARNRTHPSGLVLWEPIWEPDRLAPWLCPDRKEFDLDAELSRVACPVLAFATAADAVASARALVARLPAGCARFERVPGADAAAVGVLTAAFLASAVPL